jgi:hypothetical protein
VKNEDIKVKGSWYISYTCYDFYNYFDIFNVMEIDSYKNIVKYLEVWHKISTWEELFCTIVWCQSLKTWIGIYNIRGNELLLIDP